MPHQYHVSAGGANLLVTADSHGDAAARAVRVLCGRVLPTAADAAPALATCHVTGPDARRVTVLVRFGWRFVVETSEES